MVCISIVNHFANVLLMFPMIYSKLSCSVIDNKPIQCLHGKVPVSKVGSMKRLSAKAWGILFSKVSLCLIILRIVKHFMMHSYPFPSYFCFQHLCMHTCVFFISLCIAYNFFFLSIKERLPSTSSSLTYFLLLLSLASTHTCKHNLSVHVCLIQASSSFSYVSFITRLCHHY